ncbi:MULTISPECIES: DUF1997 domain-containing protein [Cyanophyceae]|uniref:DUF1997 domain-containing protein n=1 Tax=Cyanophyceae TaxID=3028117 RepID=UPI0016823E8C|nr:MULTISPECIES: DUF1997 domain-containing protein [Cyanophyceae]MBD1918834.1 DUF1997 domain-containing protein [Phormidium sp. FACHB-77]MBD2033323.1 DUF1997 domain-containing protein [Phormidium sp. FACHB-322]MBD2053744.1 DUF1997 domain-containing protein [Leptolyngbya sp. FACHB-60]
MKEFHASQTLRLRVPNEAIPIEHYLRQPQRLVQAITDPRRIEMLGDGLYRLSLRPLQFFGISIEPTADLRVWSLADGTLRLESVACRVKGPEYLSFVNDSFGMALQGTLTPQRQATYTELQGQADLQIHLELPPPVRFLPTSVLDRTGKTFLSGILGTIKHRIERQLVEDYRAWVATTHRSPQVSPQGSLQGRTVQG